MFTINYTFYLLLKNLRPLSKILTSTKSLISFSTDDYIPPICCSLLNNTALLVCIRKFHMHLSVPKNCFLDQHLPLVLLDQLSLCNLTHAFRTIGD